MNIYLVNAILLVITTLLYRKKRIIVKKTTTKTQMDICDISFLLFWFVLLSCEYGLRGNFTTDYVQYERWFATSPYRTMFGIISDSNIEKGFLLLNYAVARFTSEYYVMNFVYGVLTIGLFFLAIEKNTEISWPSILVWMGLGVFYAGFNLTAQMLAVGIFAVSVRYIYEKKPIKFLITILMAISVHKSALYVMPMYGIQYLNIRRKNSRIIITVLICVGLLFTIFIRPLSILMSVIVYGETYSSGDTVIEGQSIGYLLKHVMMTCIIMYHHHLFDITKTKDKIIYLGSILSCILVIWSGQIALIQRFAYYFIIFPMLAIGHIAEKNKEREQLKLMLNAFFFVMQIGWFTGEYYTFMNNR